MASLTAPNPEPNSAPDEESPLLSRAPDPSIDDGHLERSAEGDQTKKHLGLEEVSTARLAVTLGSIWIGVFLAALDGTVVATLSGPISNSFDSLTALSWIASSFFIANAALQPLSGKLTDIFSRRYGLVFSNIFFAIGTLICGLAKTESLLLFGRVVAGIGGGGLTAICTFVTSDLVPLRQRGVWQGFGNLFFGLGSGLGGFFGGWISDRFGWRWAFLVQVPVIVLSGTVVWFTVKIPVKETNDSRLKRVDYLGSLALIATLVLLLIGLNSGGNNVPWSHPLVIVSLCLVPLGLAVFVLIEEKYVAEPIIPIRLLLQRTPLAACLVNWSATQSFFGILYYMPIYFSLQGLSSSATGARLAAQALGAAIGSLGCGFVMKATGRYYLLSVMIQLVFVASHVCFSFLKLDTTGIQPLIYLAMSGFGYGSMLTITLVALISSIDHEYQAVITSASYAFRSTGTVIGITISSTAFQNVLQASLWHRFGSEPDAAKRIEDVRQNLDAIKDLPNHWRQGVEDSYMDGLRAVFHLTLGISLLSMLSSLLMKEHTLHSNLARK